MIFVEIKKAASDKLTAVFFVASIVLPKESNVVFAFLLVSTRLLMSFLISMRDVSPSLAVLRIWMRTITKYVPAITATSVSTSNKN